MDLPTSALNQIAHPVLKCHIGPNTDYLSWNLSSSSQRNKRKCNLSIRSTAERISSEHSLISRWDWDNVPRRAWFKESFIFGASTSAYQIEGAWNECGKGPSTWDHFCHNHPDKIDDWSNGDVAMNSYHLYEKDVGMLKKMGMDAYGFSISWPRILPKGTLEGGINHDGIQYYKNLINLLKENGIEPYVTIFHWDTPQALQDMYGGFLDKRIVKDYTDFANLCFCEFGDQVKNWFTFNEPHIFSSFSYGTGEHAPGLCSPGLGCAIPCGDSLREPYLVGHHILLAHATVADLYHKRYNKSGDGRIGIVLDVMGYEPYEKTFLDEQARARSIDFNLGWFMEPLFRGDYPFSMRSLVGNRLPYFTSDEQKKLVGSSGDMVGLNYYTSNFSKHIDISEGWTPKLNTDDAYAKSELKGPDGKDIGPDTGINWLKLYPKGLKDVLMIIKEKYGNPPIYITENGCADMDGGKLSMKEALDDHTRLNYLWRHFAILRDSINAGANVHGHFTWSLLDTFEWSSGYTPRFGLIYVDRNDGFKRYMKKSAEWFRDFNNRVVIVPEDKKDFNNGSMIMSEDEKAPTAGNN